MSEGPEAPKTTSRRSLSLFDCICIIVGTIIGAGIFQVPSTLSGVVPSEFWMIAIWFIGGAIALIGAMCFAELTTTYPDKGGDYGYLKRAFGRHIAFAFSWTAFWVIRPGNIGAMALIFGNFAKEAFTESISSLSYAFAAIVGVTLINLLGIRAGKWSQNVLTVAKVAGILLIVIASLMYAPEVANQPTSQQTTAIAGAGESAAENVGEPKNLDASPQTDSQLEQSPNAPADEKDEVDEAPSFASWFSLAIVFVMFAFGGWNDIAFVAHEAKDPQRNLLRALVLGTLAVLAIYLFFNLALLLGLGQERMAELGGLNAPTEFIQQRLGALGGRLLATLVCISCLGAVSAMIFTSPRIYWATAADYPFFRAFAGSHEGGWWRAILLQGVLTSAFIAYFGQNERGFDLVVLASAPYFWTFLALTVSSLIVSRILHAGEFDGFRVPLYPIFPLIFILVCLFMSYRAYEHMLGQGFTLQAILIGSWIIIGVIVSVVLSGRSKPTVEQTNKNQPS